MTEERADQIEAEISASEDEEAKLLAELNKQQEEEAAEIKLLAVNAENQRQEEIRVSNTVKNSMRGRRRGPWRARIRDQSDGSKKEDEEGEGAAVGEDGGKEGGDHDLGPPAGWVVLDVPTIA